MAGQPPPPKAQQQVVRVGEHDLEVFQAGDALGARLVCAAHPAESFGPGTAELLAGLLGVRAICTSPNLIADAPQGGRSLEEMVVRIEGVRRALGLPPWIFWGMSGGGWLAQIYARRYPGGLAGVVIESACLCFRERLADPRCVLSPFFPAWRDRLLAIGLLDEGSHLRATSAVGAQWLPVEGVGEVLRRPEGPALVVAPAPISPLMKRMMPALWEFDSRAWIATVEVPALVLCGTADPIVPLAHSRAVAEAISGAAFVEIAGAGHTPTSEENPAVQASFDRWAASLPPAEEPS